MYMNTSTTSKPNTQQRSRPATITSRTAPSTSHSSSSTSSTSKINTTTKPSSYINKMPADNNITNTTTFKPNLPKNKWIFTHAHLDNTPSIRLGMSKQDELMNRRTTAGLIRKIGRELNERVTRPSNLAVNTAMVFMHRFYMFHPFQRFPPKAMAPCALFLAAKIEETPLKLEYFLRTTRIVLEPSCEKDLVVGSKEYEPLQQALIANENLLLQTLGFELDVVHPHTSVVICSEKIKMPDTLTRMAYNLATNSLHFTTMCLTYQPSLLACICIYLASRRVALEVGKSIEGDWWTFIDPRIDKEAIKKVTNEYLSIIEKCKTPFNTWMNSSSNSNKRIKLEN